MKVKFPQSLQGINKLLVIKEKETLLEINISQPDLFDKQDTLISNMVILNPNEGVLDFLMIAEGTLENPVSIIEGETLVIKELIKEDIVNI